MLSDTEYTEQLNTLLSHLPKKRKEEIFSKLPRSGFHPPTNQLLDIIQAGGEIKDWCNKTGHSKERASHIILSTFRKKGLSVDECMKMLGEGGE